MNKVTEQIVAQFLTTLVLAFIGKFLGQNILIATGFGMIVGMLARLKKE